MDDRRQWGINNDIWVVIGKYKVVIRGWYIPSVWYKHQYNWVRCHFEVKFFWYLERGVSDKFIYVKHWSNYFYREVLRNNNIFLVLNSHRPIIVIEPDFKQPLFPTLAPLIPDRTYFQEFISLKALNTRIDTDGSLSFDTLLKVQSDCLSELVHLCDINSGTFRIDPDSPYTFQARVVNIDDTHFSLDKTVDFVAFKFALWLSLLEELWFLT